jgi:hypothetical protein
VHINRKRQSDSQPALDAQSSAQEAKPARRAFQAYSVQRIALSCLGVLGTGGLLLLAGCPANLEDPQRFDIMGTNGGAGPGGGAGPSGAGSAGAPATIVPAPSCATDIFKASCTPSCHFPGGGALMAGLDLTGADVANRLVNVTATHSTAAPNTSCAPAKFIDPANPSASWLLAKVNGTQGMCGLQMPFGMTPLGTDQLACITAFVMSEGSGGPAPAGAAGAAATGTGGAAAGGAAATGAGSGGM